MVLLSLKAGLRAGEIAGLRWNDIDLDGRTLLLRQTKGEKPRQVPIASALMPVLTTLKAEARHDHVFASKHRNRGEPLTANAVTVWFRDLYRRRMGWQDFSSHSGRRTFVTRAARKVIEAGGSLKDVQALAGHADLRTTSRYIDQNEDAQRKLVDMV